MGGCYVCWPLFCLNEYDSLIRGLEMKAIGIGTKDEY